MPEQTYTPLYSELLTKLGKLKTKKQKVKYLQENNSDSLRMVIKSSFDPKFQWLLPEGLFHMCQTMHQRELSIQT